MKLKSDQNIELSCKNISAGGGGRVGGGGVDTAGLSFWHNINNNRNTMRQKHEPTIYHNFLTQLVTFVETTRIKKSSILSGFVDFSSDAS